MVPNPNGRPSAMKPATLAAKIVAARIRELGIQQQDVYKRLHKSQGWWWVRMNTPKAFPFAIVNDLVMALNWSVTGPEAKKLEEAVAADHGRRIGAAAPYVNLLEEENRRLRDELARLRTPPTRETP